jgi:GTP cyclohydrolase II
MRTSTNVHRLDDNAAESGVRVQIVASAELPSEFGQFRVHVFRNSEDSHEHVALVRGQVAGAADVMTRLHSECLTGDAFGSLRCDCRAQLASAMSTIGAAEHGIVLYLRQEGRGIGLANKIAAYALQQQGYDTVDANVMLGFAADERDYGVAAAMLRALGVCSVALMTNNPDKIQKLSAAGIEVSRRIAHEMEPNPHNRAYLATKAERSGHLLTIPFERAASALPAPARPAARQRHER